MSAQAPLMRFLLLLIFGAFTALVVPYVIHEGRSDLFPAGTDVLRAYRDAQEMARMLLESWQTGREPTASEPIFEEKRAWSTVVVVATAAQWFHGFMIGAILGLLLLNVRGTTLAIVCVMLGLALYSCTGVKVTHDLTPETVRGVRLFYALFMVAALAGFFTARSFKRTTV